MSKFKPVLSDDELDALIIEYNSNRTPPARNLLKTIEQAVQAKLAEQNTPVAWLNEETGDVISSELKDDAPEMLKGYDTPLYRCLVPNSQVNLDNSNHIADMRKIVTPLAKRKIQSKIDEGEYRYLKGATVLVNEHGRAAIVNYGGAFYWVENSDMYVEFHRAETQFEPDHIPADSKMVDDADEALRKELDLVGLDMGAYSSPKEALAALIDWHVSVATDPRANGGWQLVPVEPTAEMCDAADFEGEFSFSAFEQAEDFWSAMLAAAPRYEWSEE